MQLLFLVVAVVVSTVCLASLLPGTAVRGRLSVAAVVLIAAVTSFEVMSQLWPTITSLTKQRQSQAAIPSQSARVAGGAALGLNTPFIDWARQQMHPGDHFFVMPKGPASDAATYQWTTAQLADYFSVRTPQKADVLIFYNVDPRNADWDKSAFDRPVRFAPNFAVARRKAQG